MGEPELNDLEVEEALAIEEVALANITDASEDEDDDGEED